MKRKTFLFAAIVVTVCGLGLMVRAQFSDVPPLRPFVITHVMSSPTTGPYPYRQIRLLAVRQDGSTVLLTQTPRPEGNGVVYIRDIKDVTSGVETVVEPLSESTKTTKLTQQDIAAYKVESSARCKGTESEKILGLRVYYREEQKSVNKAVNPPAIPVPHRSITRVWSSPTVGCLALQQESIIERYEDGQWKTDVDTTVTAIRVDFVSTDPYFEVPTDYTERSPGQIVSELARRHPKRFSLSDMSGADQAYWERRK